MNAENETRVAPKAKHSGPRRWGTGIAVALFVLVGVILATNPRLRGALLHPIDARRPSANSCIANLKQIDGAVQQWVLQNQMPSTSPYTLSDPNLLRYLRGSALPVCPKGGRYAPGETVAHPPNCTVPGHTL